MTRIVLDKTNNTSLDRLIANIEANFIDLYAGFGGVNPSITSLTTSGDATIGGNETVAGTLGVTGLSTLASAKLDSGTKTASATGGAATLDKAAGVITTEALTTAAAALYTLTLTNNKIAATDQVFAALRTDGTNSAGGPDILSVTPGSGQVVIVVKNDHASAALNGTLKLSFAVLKN